MNLLEYNKLSHKIWVQILKVAAIMVHVVEIQLSYIIQVTTEFRSFVFTDILGTSYLVFNVGQDGSWVCRIKDNCNKPQQGQ